MADCKEFQFGLVCLLMATFTGLAGFVIVFHYATNERPLEQFAIVVDAGSTQTRSSLFMIGLDAAAMLKHTSELEDSRDKSAPLSSLLEVKQVSTCVNGGPLSALKSQQGARLLVDKCLSKFATHIRRLDFINSEGQVEPSAEEEEQPGGQVLDSEEVASRLALLNHRVNSVTHMHLGATAGIRALSIINQTKAREKIDWMNSAIEESNQQLELGPYINKGFVDIISGADEAAFGWTSVNFVADALQAEHHKPTSVVNQASAEQRLTIGTLELGGASSQIAYQVAEHSTDAEVAQLSMEPKVVELFKGNYKLATRSDLCVGMSQAILRVKFILLKQFYDSVDSELDGLVRLENPCFQNGAAVNLSSSDISEVLKAPCLAGNSSDANQERLRSSLNKTNAATTFQFYGTGNTDLCNALLSHLLEPELCKQHFSLCAMPPANERRAPPKNMTFVTISGYNKALQVLNLSKNYEPSASEGKPTTEQTVADKLGGYSIDYLEFSEQTRSFCASDIDTLAQKYPKLHKAYHAINCLQLVYINKLLTEFYLFDPLANWNQLKFLIFPVAARASSEAEAEAKQHDDKNDIGWSLGLLLNATSGQFSAKPTNDILYHHGSSLTFIMRTTVFLMLACVLMALSLIVVSVFAVRGRCRNKLRLSYINHSHDAALPNV